MNAALLASVLRLSAKDYSTQAQTALESGDSETFEVLALVSSQLSEIASSLTRLSDPTT